ncbi:DUF3710 domain-containing protein [Umezawaea tangerina]|uniref:Uncharacterized protein DUF3710 n=1 Tax=Umezawaea tangerina TaxID=84725 RepID=A0A2T0SA33_9PSEU|nr:DUF3710 domain-containing protein [Umezawaea tangerina]PRY30279.1 uncharacterized protein DUF3710 [Umezawaea tangerina]
MFGRRRKRGRHATNRETALDVELDDDGLDVADDGPYDEADAPNDGVTRLELGSVRLPVPDGAQLQVEMDPAGAVRAVHLLTPVGQLTVSAFAAPRTGGLWKEVGAELIAQLKEDGARINRENGDWGEEITARNSGVHLRFVGVDGPRWLLRGVAAGPEEHAPAIAAALYDLLRGTVVVRGTQPMPVRTPLPIELPEAIAKHIAAQAGG